MTASVEDRVFLVIDALSSFASSRKPDSEQMEDLSKIRAEIKAMYAERVISTAVVESLWDIAIYIQRQKWPDPEEETA